MDTTTSEEFGDMFLVFNNKDISPVEWDTEASFLSLELILFGLGSI